MVKYRREIATLILLTFFLSQLLGLLIFSKSFVIVQDQGNITINQQIPVEGVGDAKKEFFSLLISLAVAIIIFVTIMKLRLHLVWNLWYGLALLISYYFALYPFIFEYALFAAILFIIVKIKFRNLVIYNLLEIISYIGVSLVISSLLNLFYASILLILLSFYDFIAVRKTSLMKEIASYQLKTKKFFGLIFSPSMLNKSKDEIVSKASGKLSSKSKISRPSEVGIIGGGDFIFPMIFLMTEFKLFSQILLSKPLAFLFTSLTLIFTTLGLAYLIFFSKNKMDPALPYLTSGTLIGFFASSLLYILVF